MKSSQLLEKELKNKANPLKADLLSRFFKTKPDEYGEKEIFWGITVPELRKLAKLYVPITYSEIELFLYSAVHEKRLLALFILVEKYQNRFADEKIKKTVYTFFVKNIIRVNNWDLVDLTAPSIIGNYLCEKPKHILYKWARSKNMWIRRISIISTLYFIRQNKFTDSLKIADILLYDKKDLIQKAVGWMLREIGKRDIEIEENFLKNRYKSMPRTMLRYAIEKFQEKKRIAYLKGMI